MSQNASTMKFSCQPNETLSLRLGIRCTILGYSRLKGTNVEQSWWFLWSLVFIVLWKRFKDVHCYSLAAEYSLRKIFYSFGNLGWLSHSMFVCAAMTYTYWLANENATLNGVFVNRTKHQNPNCMETKCTRNIGMLPLAHAYDALLRFTISHRGLRLNSLCTSYVLF